MSTDYTMLEGGLGRFVKLDKPDFVGKDAIAGQHQRGIDQTFVTLTVDAGACDSPYLATVWDGDERVGLVTSGNYGHRIDASVALAVINVSSATEGRELNVEIYGQRCRAVVQPDAPLYDPDNSRLLA